MRRTTIQRAVNTLAVTFVALIMLGLYQNADAVFISPMKPEPSEFHLGNFRFQIDNGTLKRVLNNVSNNGSEHVSFRDYFQDKYSSTHYHNLQDNSQRLEAFIAGIHTKELKQAGQYEAGLIGLSKENQKNQRSIDEENELFAEHLVDPKKYRNKQIAHRAYASIAAVLVGIIPTYLFIHSAITVKLWSITHHRGGYAIGDPLIAAGYDKNTIFSSEIVMTGTVDRSLLAAKEEPSLLFDVEKGGKIAENYQAHFEFRDGSGKAVETVPTDIPAGLGDYDIAQTISRNKLKPNTNYSVCLIVSKKDNKIQYKKEFSIFTPQLSISD